MAERVVSLYSKEQIQERVIELGQEIARDYKDKNLVCVLVLKGSFVFGADLVRAIDVERLRVDFLATRSYGEGTESSGVVQITQDLSRPVEGEDVLIVEDIVDTGLTLAHLIELMKTRRPKSLRVCTLLSKPSRKKVEVEVNYVGFTIEDKFVIGYGLDYEDRFRNIPYIGHKV